MRKKIFTVLSVIFGLMMINSGLNKFFNYMPMPKDMPEAVMQIMAAFMQLGWLFPLVAIAEIVGGILFMIPRFRALGAIVILPVMIGIVLFNAIQSPQTLVIALVLFAINVWAIAEDWRKYMPLVAA